MPDGVYHFEGVHAVAASEDGKHIILDVVGASGTAGLSLPAADAPRIVAMIVGAASAARERHQGKGNIRAMEAREIRVHGLHSDKAMQLLEIVVETGAPGLVFHLPDGALVRFAKGILEAEGVLVPGRSGPPQ